MRILIIEDHKKINDLLTLFAKQEDHIVFQAFSAEDALHSLANHSFDLVITDLMLPRMQGEQLISKIRENSDIYIIVISAKVDLDNRLDVLSIGADDYITKPFSVEEVMMKLKNIEKRIGFIQPSVKSFYQGELVMKPLLREIIYKGDSLVFTKHEYDLLLFLANHRDRIFSRDELLITCFKDSDAYDRVIDVYIKNIRKKLCEEALNPKYIKTHYGVGYQFVGEQDD